MTATESPVIHDTFVLERNFPQRPSRVFSAFSQPAIKRRWYAEGDHDIKNFHMDFHVGGTEVYGYSFRPGHPIAGSEILNESVFQDIVDEKRIVMTSRMSLNGKAIVVMLATFEFVPAEQGTDLILTHQGTYIDWPDGAKMIQIGWTHLVDRLQKELAQ